MNIPTICVVNFKHGEELGTSYTNFSNSGRFKITGLENITYQLASRLRIYPAGQWYINRVWTFHQHPVAYN